MSTRGRRGKLEKNVDVYSNDPKTPKLQLKIGGLVELIADFEPNRLNLKNVLKGTSASETVKVVGKEPDKLQITELVVSDQESLKAELVKSESGPPSVKVTFIAGDKERHFSGKVTAKTNLEGKNIELFVYGMVTSDLVADKPVVFFNTFDAKNPPTFQIKVSSISGKPFKLTKVEEAGGVVTGVVEKKDKDWLVNLTLAKNPEQPRGKIRVLTDRKDQEALEFNYSVKVPGAAPGVQGPIQPKILRPLDPNKPQLQVAPSGAKRAPLMVKPRLNLQPAPPAPQPAPQPNPGTK